MNSNREKKFCWCPHCVSKALIVVRFAVFLLYLLFAIGVESTQAQELYLSPHGSNEARLRLLELIAEGKLSQANIEITIAQGSDGQKFKISTKKEDEAKEVKDTGLQIHLVPEIEDAFTFPSIASWSFLFNKNRELKEVRYYYQNNEHSYLKAIPYLATTEFTLLINNNIIYENINIPISIGNFIRMPTRQFIQETKQVLYLDWVFPSKKFMHINEQARNFASYLSTSLARNKEELQNHYKEENISAVPDRLVVKRRAAIQAEKSKRIILDTTNYILEYIQSNSVDDSQFIPIGSNKNKISLYDERYLLLYAESVASFLKKVPGLYTSASVFSNPFALNEKKTLEYLYTNLFLMTAKFPGVWYLTPIYQEILLNDQTVQRTVSLAVLIPYFNYDGTFTVYGWDEAEEIINEFEDLDASGYFYNVHILRIPDKQQKFGY